VSLPDFDVDFCVNRREEVMRYVAEKYGRDQVAQIVTFGVLKARSCIRDVGRVMGLAYTDVDKIAKLVPEELTITLATALEKEPRLRELVESTDELKQLYATARALEGLCRQSGMHAAGLVIGRSTISDLVPVKAGPNDELVTQFAKEEVEKAGLVKFDFLGLKNLTMIDHAVKLIDRRRQQEGLPPLDLDNLPLDDLETYRLLSRADTAGVFQLESSGFREIIRRLKPDRFEDIIALVALYRPGPLKAGMVEDYINRKHGREAVTYLHPLVKATLEPTYGVMVYQEQVMRILNRLGGIKLANAYTCIKAISKKKLPIIARFREEFVEGAHAQGLSKKSAEELFGLIEKFAGYGFNKSHSTAYALIAYMTAYLKAHYPVEFMAALLSSDMPNRNFTKKDSLVEHLEDCQRMHIEVVPPDVNISGADFTVAEGKILFGMGAIKGCGLGAAEAIVANRQAQGPFRSLFDFCERLDPGAVNRTAIEALVKSGAMDNLGPRRAQLFQVIDRALQGGAAKAADRRSGQKALFADEDEGPSPSADVGLPDVPEWDQHDKLAKEKEVLGFYRSSHPLAEHQAALATYCSHTTAQGAKLEHRAEVMLGGMISAVKFAHTKNPRPGSPSRYAMFDLEDMEGGMRCILWPEPFQQYGELVRPDSIVVALGAIDKRGGGDEANLIVNELIPLEELPSRCTSLVRLRLSEETHGVAGMERLYEILRGYPGQCPLQLVIALADGTRVTCSCQSLQLEISQEMRRRVEELLGAENVQLLATRRSSGSASRSVGRSNGH